MLTLWAYVVVRAAHVAFTADESISFADLHGLARMSDTANNQWLNTAGMWLSGKLFGSSVFALRLPNVLSFGLYGASVVVLVGCLRSRIAAALCLVGLVADPFLLEFFGLARGYGLSLAFCAVALAALLSQRTGVGMRGELARLVVIALAGVLAFYANFSSLNFVWAVMAAAVVQICAGLRRCGVRIDRRSVLVALAVVGVMLGAMAPGLLHLKHLQSAHELYYGGHTGFVQDTIGTLVQTWGYVYSYGVPLHQWAITLAWIISAVALILLGWAAFLGIARREVSAFQIAGLVLVLSVCASLFEWHFFGTLYPIDRAALTLVLCFVMLVALSTDRVFQHIGTRSLHRVLAGPVVVAVLLAVVNLLRAANVTSALTWSFDASAEDAINHIAAFQHSHFRLRLPFTMIVPISREFALSDYYAPQAGIRWLAIRVAPISTPGADIYDVPAGQATTVPPGSKLLATLHQDGTQLWLGARLDARPRSAR